MKRRQVRRFKFCVPIDRFAEAWITRGEGEPPIGLTSSFERILKWAFRQECTFFVSNRPFAHGDDLTLVREGYSRHNQMHHYSSEEYSEQCLINLCSDEIRKTFGYVPDKLYFRWNRAYE